MPASPAVESPTDSQPEQPRRDAMARLRELKRALQRQVRRKLNAYELAALDRAALMTLRAEIAAWDVKATSNDLVRLDNAARRARADFERICRIAPPAPPEQAPLTLGEVLARG
jgi:hypothetical protein